VTTKTKAAAPESAAPKKVMTVARGAGLLGGFLPNFQGATNSGNSTTSSKSPEQSNSSGGGEGSSNSGDSFTCSAAIGSGAYGHPIAVNLSCSSTATIRYCLNQGSCCDPETAGIPYSGPIIIGAEDGSYCLSFEGENSSNIISSLIQHNYTISSELPDLEVSLEKIFYQTTQLEGSHFIHSDDFGKNGYELGGINLKSHNPGPAGENMECKDIVQNYGTLPSPTPLLVFNPLNLLPFSSSQQLTIPLPLEKLDYGDNYLTNYIINNNFASPLYSCSTNLITLKDFDLFSAEAAHGDVGTNSVREFTGSFIPLGPFEPTETVFRGPAGSAIDQDGEQELRAGSFGIFY
jgi:hypothetical protein